MIVNICVGREVDRDSTASIRFRNQMRILIRKASHMERHDYVGYYASEGNVFMSIDERYATPEMIAAARLRGGWVAGEK